MNGRFVISLSIASALAAWSCRETPAPAQPAALTATGTIRGHVRLTGTPPENPAIRLRSDPMCDKMSGGKPGVQEAVLVNPDGSLANVFVQLQGSFPATAAPTGPVVIDQHGCIYSPRVVGLRVGQPLRVSNSDPGLHNVHGVLAGSDVFNIGQPMAGMVNEFRLTNEGIVRLQCDVHGWMVAFAGVVSHPYFAVTGAEGTFELRDVPTGSHTIQAWHEQYGLLTSNVRVEAGEAADVDFTYSGKEKPATPQ